MPTGAVYTVDYGGERQSAVYAVDYGVTADGVTNDRGLCRRRSTTPARPARRRSSSLSGPSSSSPQRIERSPGPGGAAVAAQVGVSLVGAGRGATILKGIADPAVSYPEGRCRDRQGRGRPEPRRHVHDRCHGHDRTTGGTLAAAT
jgi:hypothetical protein